MGLNIPFGAPVAARPEQTEPSPGFMPKWIYRDSCTAEQVWHPSEGRTSASKLHRKPSPRRRRARSATWPCGAPWAKGATETTREDTSRPRSDRRPLLAGMGGGQSGSGRGPREGFCLEAGRVQVDAADDPLAALQGLRAAQVPPSEEWGDDAVSTKALRGHAWVGSAAKGPEGAGWGGPRGRTRRRGPCRSA